MDKGAFMAGFSLRRLCVWIMLVSGFVPALARANATPAHTFTFDVLDNPFIGSGYLTVEIPDASPAFHDTSFDSRYAFEMRGTLPSGLAGEALGPFAETDFWNALRRDDPGLGGSSVAVPEPGNNLLMFGASLCSLMLLRRR
jgi:hypothetical protein